MPDSVYIPGCHPPPPPLHVRRVPFHCLQVKIKGEGHVGVVRPSGSTGLFRITVQQRFYLVCCVQDISEVPKQYIGYIILHVFCRYNKETSCWGDYWERYLPT